MDRFSMLHLTALRHLSFHRDDLHILETLSTVLQAVAEPSEPLVCSTMLATFANTNNRTRKGGIHLRNFLDCSLCCSAGRGASPHQIYRLKRWQVAPRYMSIKNTRTMRQWLTSQYLHRRLRHKLPPCHRHTHLLQESIENRKSVLYLVWETPKVN